MKPQGSRRWRSRQQEQTHNTIKWVLHTEKNSLDAVRESIGASIRAQVMLEEVVPA